MMYVIVVTGAMTAPGAEGKSPPCPLDILGRDCDLCLLVFLTGDTSKENEDDWLLDEPKR